MDIRATITRGRLVAALGFGLLLFPQFFWAQAPRVEFFTPISAAVGDTIQVSGSNFSGVGSENIVYFGPARARDVVPNSSQPDRGFRVVVPQGASHERITVTVRGLTGYSRLLFLPRFLGAGAVAFENPVYVGPSRNAVLVDVNGDNKLDLATVGWTGAQYNFTMYLNRSAGGATTFDPPDTFHVTNAPANLLDIARGDFDGDGNQDIVIADVDTGAAFDNLVIFRNTGVSPYFQSPVFISERNGGGVGMMVADMDGDGRPDIIRSDRNDQRNGFIRIMKNISTGPGTIAFMVDTLIPTIRSPWNVAVADFNTDGHPDIVWPMNVGGSFGTVDSVAILQNNGSRSYGPISHYRLNRPFLSQLEVLDFDRDTKTDIVVVTDNGRAATFLRNTSSGTGIGFVLKDSIRLGVNLRRPSVADWNGDARADVVVPASTAGVVFMFLNKSVRDGDFTFDTTSFVMQATQNFSVAGDLNNDGKPDLIAAGGSGSAGTLGMSFRINITPSAPVSPSLQSPGNNSANVQQPVRFVWHSSVRAAGYHLQVALTPDFSFPALNDSSLTDTLFETNALAHNATYYWRVAGRTSFGDGLYSQPRSFSTITTASMTGEVVFPPNPTQTNYRLVSIPGVSRFTVGDILSGAQRTDWRIFRENGAEPPNDLTELSAGDQLKVGEGYLVVRKGTFGFSRTVQMPAVATNGTYSIPIEKKWILIGNPFERPVTWQSVVVANNLDSMKTLWTYRGGIQETSTLQPFEGYLIDNRGGVDSLKVPYPFPSVRASPPQAIPFDWKIQLVLETDGMRDGENYIGVSPHATFERDVLERHKPPLFLNNGTITFSRPQWDAQNPLFTADYRPAIGDGQVWEFDVRNERLSKSKIRIIGVNQLAEEFEVMLVNKLNSIPVNVRENPDYEYQTVGATMSFKLIVGKRGFVANEIHNDTPKEFRLEQNYPNPFNPRTAISFSIPTVSDARLEILSLLGERVTVLGEQIYTPGRYTVLWDAAKHATGVYLCRFIVNGKPFATQKMLLLK